MWDLGSSRQKWELTGTGAIQRLYRVTTKEGMRSESEQGNSSVPGIFTDRLYQYGWTKLRVSMCQPLAMQAHLHAFEEN